MVPLKGLMEGILSLLEQGVYIIHQLKGIEREGKDPLLEEPPTCSGRGPTSINEGV